MRKGNLNKGHVKITFNQKKKHYTQMSAEELAFLKLQIHKIKHLKSSWHLKNKNHIKYDIKDIWKVINDENIEKRIIEFNKTHTKRMIDKRVLLRSKEVYPVNINGKIIDCNLCFVISLINHKLITVYYNESSDYHDTIDWKRYDKNLKIV